MAVLSPQIHRLKHLVVSLECASVIVFRIVTLIVSEISEDEAPTAGRGAVSTPVC